MPKVTKLFFFLISCLGLALVLWECSLPVSAQGTGPPRRVNVPYFNSNVKFEESAAFWFGQVNPTSNYADVRVGYNNHELVVNVAIFDRRLWYDSSPTAGDLTDWDAVTLYLNLNGNLGDAPQPNTYRFVAQLNHWQSRPGYQAAYQGNGSSWGNIHRA